LTHSMSPALCAILSATWLLAIIGYFWWRDTARIGRIRGLLKAGGLLIDAGTAQQYATDHAPAAVNIPAEDLPVRQSEIGARGRVILVYARSSFRSAAAAQTLRGIGFQSVTNIGTLRRWRADSTSSSADVASHRLGYEALGGAPGSLVGAAVGASAGLLGALAGALVGGATGAFAGAFFDARLSERAARTRRFDSEAQVPSSSSVAREVHVFDDAKD
jgi:rhodanese-related sulfurtransferase